MQPPFPCQRGCHGLEFATLNTLAEHHVTYHHNPYRRFQDGGCLIEATDAETTIGYAPAHRRLWTDVRTLTPYRNGQTP